MNDIENLIFQTIDEINKQMPPEQRLEKLPTTIIVGEGGTLDSLGVVNFFVSLEEKVVKSTGQSINLLNDDILSNEESQLISVAQISHYISEQI